MTALHKQYGPIVSLAPGMIAVSDQQSIRQILVMEDWPKSHAIYANFRQNPDRPTLLAYTDKKAYGVRKRLVSSMFGLRYIRGMEPIMRDCVAVALDHLHTSCRRDGGTTVVDIHRLMRALAVDIIGATTFGESFHVVQQGSHPLPKKIEYSLLLSGIFQFLPWLKGLPGFPTRDPYIDQFTRSIVDGRREVIKSGKPQRHDLLQKLVEAVDDAPQSSFRTSDLQDETVVLLTAGSETTATAEIFLLLLLAKNPEKLNALHEEIDRIYPDPGDATTAEKAGSMPYFQACVDETMRLYAAMASGSPRETTTDVSLLGYHIPKGTTVFPTTATLHRDPGLWAKPDDFLPERWLTDLSTKRDLPFYPFSAGSRVCIGKHFAMQEVYLSIVSLLRRFTLEYVPGQDESTVFRVALQLSAGKYNVKFHERSK